MVRKANLLYIFQTGYGLISLPLNLFSFATTIYYLLINNVPFLKDIFPRYELFILIGFGFGIPFTLFLGWLYIKSELYKASTRTSPFSILLIPTQIPMYQAIAKLCHKEGLEAEATKLEELIKKSKEQW
jgi:uncharacterized membrane-anchored protein YitT (DUF2179 family)